MKPNFPHIAILIIFLTVVVLPGSNAQAATYTVTNVNDSGVGSLRWAIQQANSNPGGDTIDFNIPAHLCDSGTNVCTITPSSALPSLTGDFTTIDGYSQSGAAPATDDAPAVIVIEIDGSSAGNVYGLFISSEQNLIKGLAIFNFAFDGICLNGAGANNNHIEGNFLGLDASGTAAGNGFTGVYIREGAYENKIGGDLTSQRNIISGNDQSGIEITGVGTDDNSIHGNNIGTSPDGMSARANGQHGVWIRNRAKENSVIANLISANQYGVMINGLLSDVDSTSGNYITGNGIGVAQDLSPLGNTVDGILISYLGQDNDLIANYIAYNGDDGIQVDTPTAFDNNIVYNSLLKNGGKGIYLTNGANNGISPPVINQFHLDSFSVSGAACPNCYVQIFASHDDDGEGEVLVGEGNAGSAGEFLIQLFHFPGPFLTATATNLVDLDGTSEFSEVFTYSLNWLPMTINQ